MDWTGLDGRILLRSLVLLEHLAVLTTTTTEVESSTEDKLTFEENGQTLVQEQIITEETGILGEHHLQKHFLINFYLQRYMSPRTAATLSRCTWCRKGKFY